MSKLSQAKINELYQELLTHPIEDLASYTHMVKFDELCLPIGRADFLLPSQGRTIFYLADGRRIGCPWELQNQAVEVFKPVGIVAWVHDIERAVDVSDGTTEATKRFLEPFSTFTSYPTCLIEPA